MAPSVLSSIFELSYRFKDGESDVVAGGMSHESLGIFVHYVPNLPSVRDPTSLASGIAMVVRLGRKPSSWLAGP